MSCLEFKKVKISLVIHSNSPVNGSCGELGGKIQFLTNFLNIKYIKQIRLDQAVRREYLLVVGVDAGVVLHDTHVGDEAAGEHLHPCVVRHDRLRDGAHPHGVHAELPQHLELGHSLVVGSPDHGVDPLPHDPVQVEGPGHLLPDVPELFVVEVVCWEEPRTEPAVIGTCSNQMKTTFLSWLSFNLSGGADRRSRGG